MKLNLPIQYFGWLHKSFLLPILLLLLSNIMLAQNLTQSGFTGVTVPQYMASGTASRIPVVFRATVSGLTANTAYKYFVQGATNSSTGGGVDIGAAQSGAGNAVLFNSAGTTFVTTASPSLATSGTSCETFTTDA